MILNIWAQKWNVPPEATEELLRVLNNTEILPKLKVNNNLNSEQAVLQQVRLGTSKKGMRLFRNNSGAVYDKTGRLIRYGLANESKQINETIKSADLIGITPYKIKGEDVGCTIGIFTSYEIKKSNWRFTGKGGETAQNNWKNLILSLGGIARFVTKIEEI